MIIGKNEEGKAVLLRCGCSHGWPRGNNKYGYEHEAPIGRIYILLGDENTCTKCWYYGWRITGMTDEQLRRRDVD